MFTTFILTMVGRNNYNRGTMMSQVWNQDYVAQSKGVSGGIFPARCIAFWFVTDFRTSVGDCAITDFLLHPIISCAIIRFAMARGEVWFSETVVQVRLWINTCIAQFYDGTITYARHIHDAVNRTSIYVSKRCPWLAAWIYVGLSVHQFHLEYFYKHTATYISN